MKAPWASILPECRSPPRGSSVRYRSLQQLGSEGPVKAFVPSMLTS
jgi:hypothetical protein